MVRSASIRREVRLLAVLLAAGPAVAQAQMRLAQAQLPVCADPTPAQCHDPAYFNTYCGGVALGRTRVEPNHICNVTLQNDLAARAAAVPQQTVLGAPVVDAAAQVTPAAATVVARVEPHVQAARFLNGWTTTYLARAISPARVAAVNAGAIAVGDLIAADPGRPPPPPETVASCEEYAREKFWDYSLFEDRSRDLGENWRAIFNVAYGPLDRRESFGARGSVSPVPAGVDPNMRGLDQRLIGPRWSDVGGPKNTYFSTNVANAGSVAIPGGPAGLEQLLGSPLRLKGVVLADASLAPALVAGRASKRENFRWHKQMSDALVGQLDELLVSFEGPKADFKDLLDRRRDLVEKARKELIGAWLAAHAIAARECQTANNVAQHVPPANQLDAEIRAMEVCDAAYAQRDTTVRGVWNGLNNRLASLDSAIERALVDARAKNCLVTDRPVPCDWSPKQFVDRMNDLYTARREADYKACLSYTGNVFGANLLNPPGMPAGYYGRDTIALDDYIARRRAQVLAALRPLSGALNPAAGVDPSNVGEVSADNVSLGNADFNVAASYLFSWRFWGLSNVLCNVNAKFEGRFNASGTAFGRNRALISANGYADYNVFRTNLTVLDQSLINVNQNLLQEEYQLARSNIERTNNNILTPRPTMWFSILGVPVKVSAGLAGTLGLDYAANLKIHRGNPNSACNDVAAEVDGVFAPYAQVDVTADAAADFVVLAAGVKVDLTLINARLPLGVNLFLKSAQGAIAGLSLRIKSTLDLALRTLDGRVAVFGRIGVCPFCETAEKTIFSWNGIERKLPIFARDHLISVTDLRAWFNAPTRI